MVVPNILGSLIWNLLYITLLAPRIFSKYVHPWFRRVKTQTAAENTVYEHVLETFQLMFYSV